MKSRVGSNIRKYYLYQWFTSLEFFAPVIVLFWQARGLNMTQIMLLQSIYAVGVLIFELPTGALADYFGKRISIIVGTFTATLGIFIYGISHNFWQFTFGELIIALGTAFVSGADRAFVHESLIAINKEKYYKKVEGRARGLSQISRALANIGGGLIGSIGLAYTILATGVSWLVSSLVGLTFAETKEQLPREEKTEYVDIIKSSLRIVKNNKAILWFILFFAVFNSFVFNITWFNQPYLQKLGVPVVYFGIIFAIFSIISAIGSSLTDRFDKATNYNPFLAMSLIVGVSMFLIGSFPNLYIFSLWGLFSAFVVINQTLTSERILALIPSGRAATVLSFANLIRRMVYALTGPILGWISDSFGLFTAIQTNALLLLTFTSALLIVKNKFLSKS